MKEQKTNIFDKELETRFKYLHRIFEQEGHEIRLAGGAVRDILLGKEPNDLDFATTATPEEMMNFGFKIHNKPEDVRGFDRMSTTVKIVPTGIDHGTVTFNTFYGNFEVTSLRIDKECDGRHAKVEFTDNWELDAARRDFTVNAMFMDVNGRLYDFFNGVDDLSKGRLRFVGDPNKRIQEDALRIIRYFRFMSKLNIREVCSHDSKAIRKNIDLLKNISKERIWDEVKKVLRYHPENHSCFFEMMDDTGASNAVGFPIDYKDMGVRWSCEKNLVSNMGNSYIQSYAAMVIAELSTTPIKLEKFKNTWPLSNEEKRQIEFIENYKKIGMDRSDLEDMVMDGNSYDYIIALLQMTKLDPYIECLSGIKYKELPVRGQDFLDAGLPQGEKIGIMMGKAKNIWKMSRYKMDREEILNLLGCL